MVRTDSGTSYRLSKSDKPPCPAERQQQLGEYTDRPRTCQPWFLRFPQLSSGARRTPLKEIRCGGFAADSNFQPERFSASLAFCFAASWEPPSEIMGVSDLVKMNIATKASFDLEHLKPERERSSCPIQGCKNESIRTIRMQTKDILCCENHARLRRHATPHNSLLQPLPQAITPRSIPQAV